MDEKAQVKAAQDGNQEAFHWLFDRNKQNIFAIAYKYTNNREDAEDVLQETFIKAFYHLKKFHHSEETNFSSWLCRICINSSIDFLRKKKKMKINKFATDNIENTPLQTKASNPEKSAHLRQVKEKVNSALNKLTAKQRMIFILRHYQQMTTKEIAEFMDCSQGSIKKQLFRSISTLKEHIKTFLQETDYEMQKI